LQRRAEDSRQQQQEQEAVDFVHCFFCTLRIQVEVQLPERQGRGLEKPGASAEA